MSLKDAVKELNKLPEFKDGKLFTAVISAIKGLNKESEYPDLHMRSKNTGKNEGNHLVHWNVLPVVTADFPLPMLN